MSEELAADAERYKQECLDACKTIADMHAAAVGEVRGPTRGVIEDVADMRARGLAAEEALTSALAAIGELAQFHEGEEPYTDASVVPTPAQWIWKWNRATPTRRLRMAEAVLGAQETAQGCVTADHQSAVEELRAANTAIYRIRCIADIKAIAAPPPDSFQAGYREAMKKVMEIVLTEGAP